MSIWYGAVLRGDLNSIRIGSWSNVQDKSVIHAARYVFIASAMVHALWSLHLCLIANAGSQGNLAARLPLRVHALPILKRHYMQRQILSPHCTCSCSLFMSSAAQHCTCSPVLPSTKMHIARTHCMHHILLAAYSRSLHT